MTLDELRKTKVGSSARNAHLFLGAVEAAKPKPNLGSESQDPKLESLPNCGRFRITLIVVNRRPMDSHDNLRMACKPIVDAITAKLGFRSDDDSNLEWCYAQTAGRRGDCRD